MAKRTVKCRACGADIVFMKTAKGKIIPVNADTVSDGDEQFDYKRHTSHFATCTKPESFRRK